ncbi:MAG TPA: DUF1998 domain-containing protein [Tetrasphaera sp.]|nr:DUF1998 domain-containing protein [Tetrasphaera sp.]
MTSAPHDTAGHAPIAHSGQAPVDILSTLSGVAPHGPLLHVRSFPSRTGATSAMPEWINPALAAALTGAGIDALWSHQSLAAELVRSGRHTVLATGTASGKSLAYLLPGLTAVLDGTRAPNGRGATMLYLAPTKALAADQADHITRLALPGVRAATYDGDTAPEERRWIRDHANIVLTNPDLVHHSLLPGHAGWASFLRALSIVVIDESHAYRGIFGSHVALVLRRLRRVLERYRSAPVFVFASATAGEPGAHASDLVGLPVAEVTHDGSPRGALTFALWEPQEYVDEHGRPHRPAASTESARLLSRLVGGGVQTLAFARSRAGVEAVAAAANRSLAAAESSHRVAAYRGGYLPEERRALERDLRAGTLRGLAATNALELGIDIHGLDAVVMAGWPGRLSSLWQQAGRAGRRGSAALAVLVAADDPLDAYLMKHPEAIFGEPVERTVVNPGNPRLLPPHLIAAAYERRITEADEGVFGPGMWPALDELVAAGQLRRRPGGWFWPQDTRPDAVGSLRTAGEVVAIVEGASGRIIGTIDSASADLQVHPGAVHVHQGQTYVVTHLDLERASATVAAGDPGWSTQAQSRSEFTFATPDAAQLSGSLTVCRGQVTVHTQVVSFMRRLPGGEIIGRHELDLPVREFVTEGVWWILPADLVGEALPAQVVPGALHAAEHAAIGMLPLFATCDRWDIGGVSSACHPATGEPTILVYDGYAGGAGYAARGFEILPQWLSATRALIAECPCQRGCPRCVVSPKCGSGNEPLDKPGAITVLDLVLGELARGPG